MTRQIRWLVTFTQSLSFQDESHESPGGKITFEKGSQLAVEVHDAKVFMPGLGRLTVKEGEHFEFIDMSRN
jgi:hypothetical protein